MLGYVINKKSLAEIYPEQISLIGTSQGGTISVRSSRMALSRIDSLPEELVIQLVSDTSPYCVIRLSALAGSEGLIVPRSMVISKELPSALELFTPILNKLFPNRWVWRANHLYLHYPTLEITNSIGSKHTITDLIVRLTITSDTFIHAELVGSRTSFTREELAVGYVHSHLSSNTYGFTSFCRGGGSVFDRLMQTQTKYNTPFEFEMFLQQLTKYLEWESLEGNPHIRMTTIFEANRTSSPSVSFTPSASILQEFALEMLKEMKDKLVVDVSFNTFDPCIQWKHVFAAEKIVTERLKDRLTSHGWLFDYDEQAQNYILGQVSIRNHTLSSQTEDLAWTMRSFGMDLHARILENTRPRPQIQTIKRLPRQILDVIVSNMNTMLQKGLFYEGNNVTTESQGDNNTTASVANQLSAQPVS